MSFNVHPIVMYAITIGTVNTWRHIRVSHSTSKFANWCQQYIVLIYTYSFTLTP